MTTHDTVDDTSCLCTDCARELREELTKLCIVFEELEREYVLLVCKVNAPSDRVES